MANELTNVDEKNLSAQEQSELDTQIDALIERHKNNRFELNRLALEGATALAAGDKLTQEKASQGFFKRFRKTISGANNRTQDEINKDLVKAQYAAQKTLQSLAEQNLMSFELIAAVNNKFNAEMLAVNQEINDIYEVLADFKNRIDELEKNVALLDWVTLIEFGKYNGVNYRELDDETKIICIVRDFFNRVGDKQLTEKDLLYLEKAMSAVNFNTEAMILRENFVEKVSGNTMLYNHLLGEDSRLDEFATEYEAIAFDLWKSAEHVGKKFFPVEQTTTEVKAFDFALEMFCDLRQLKWAKEVHAKADEAKKLFLNYKIEDALKILAETADAGIATSRYILAVIYNEGFTVEKNPELAKELLTENILADDVCSIFFGWRLGIVTKEIAAKNSDALLTAATDGGDVFAQYELLKLALITERNIEKLEQLVAKEYFLAAHELGCKYFFGQGVEKNYETARKYFECADEMGYGPSTLKLGDIYWYGYGVTKDENKAVELYKTAYERGADDDRSICRIADKCFSSEKVKWWRIGEEKNYPICLANLGVAYAEGNGVEKNWSKAARCFERSIAGGLDVSEEALGDLYYEGGYGITQDYEKAATYYEAALAKGTKSDNLANAEYQTGDKYYFGRGVTKDYAKAVEWYKKAHEHGKGSDCIYWIGSCYDSLKNYSEALKWYLRGEEKGDSSCASSAGLLYRYGLGVERNYAEAIKHFKREIELGGNDGYSELWIAELYQEGGHGITADLVQSTVWLGKASVKGNKKAIVLSAAIGISSGVGIGGIAIGVVEATKDVAKDVARDVAKNIPFVGRFF